MKWTDTFWSAYGMTVDTTFNATASLLQNVGTLACIAGGAGFALSHAMDESVNASYFGSANTTGQVVAGANIESYKYNVNATIPFKYYAEQDSGKTYYLTDYIHPSSVRFASYALVASGAALRSVGTNLKLWQQHREDRKYIKNKYQVDAIKPELKEYAIASSDSFLSSLSFATVSCAVTSSILHFSGFIGSSHSITYPSYGQLSANSTHYQGPVNMTSIPVSFHLGQNATLDLPIIGNVLAYEQVNANALVNATYGGGLFFSNRNSSSLVVGISSAALGVSSYIGSMFFSKKTTQLRDDRNSEAQRVGYGHL
ncbi:MAG: hypothetical protein V4615_12830 [Bacteroidota bacterium]